MSVKIIAACAVILWLICAFGPPIVKALVQIAIGL